MTLTKPFNNTPATLMNVAKVEVKTYEVMG